MEGKGAVTESTCVVDAVKESDRGESREGKRGLFGLLKFFSNVSFAHQILGIIILKREQSGALYTIPHCRYK